MPCMMCVPMNGENETDTPMASPAAIFPELSGRLITRSFMYLPVRRQPPWTASKALSCFVKLSAVHAV